MSSPSPSTPVLVLVPDPAGLDPVGGPTARVVDASVPQVPVTDFAATRGDGAFETLGVFGGRAMNVIPHLERLARSAALMDLAAPDLAAIEEGIDLAIAEHLDVPELTVRVTYSRGVEGTDRPSCWVHAKASPDWSRDRSGIRVVTLDRGLSAAVGESHPWLLSGAKTLSYAMNMAALREARRRGADDVLFTSAEDWCLEGPTSTLLVQRGTTFLTTPVSAGILAGTCVQQLREVFAAEGTQLREELMVPATVASSDGAWLLSSSRLAAPITHLDGEPIPTDRELTGRFLAVLSGRA